MQSIGTSLITATTRDPTALFEKALKLIKFYAGPFELYNLTDDISEKNNLASTMPEKVRTLDAQLLSHLNQ